MLRAIQYTAIDIFFLANSLNAFSDSANAGLTLKPPAGMQGALGEVVAAAATGGKRLFFSARRTRQQGH